MLRRIAAALLCAGLLALPVQAAEQPKYVALTFDDGPSGRFTRTLLDGLHERGAKATFLLCGYRMQEDPELTERIFREGHEIGFHGYSHKTMKGMSRREIAAELVDTAALLPPGCIPQFLRPPGGVCCDAVRQVAAARNLAILSWSVDPRDWATHDTSAVEHSVLTKVSDGDIVLLHDMSSSSVRAALAIVDKLLDEDFELVTVSELARIRGTALRPGQVYTCFPREG